MCVTGGTAFLILHFNCQILVLGDQRAYCLFILMRRQSEQCLSNPVLYYNIIVRHDRIGTIFFLGKLGAISRKLSEIRLQDPERKNEPE